MKQNKKQNHASGSKPAPHTPKSAQTPALSRDEVLSIAAEAARAEIAKLARETESQDFRHGPLPSPETLALIGANVARGGSLKAREAVTYAAELYDEACARLEHATKLQDAYSREAAMFAGIPHPEKFPAPFDDFLRLIVRAKTPADATKRFRDFLRDRLKRSCVFGRIEDYPVWAEWAEKKFFEQMKPEDRQNPKWAGMTEQEIGAALEQENLEK